MIEIINCKIQNAPKKEIKDRFSIVCDILWEKILNFGKIILKLSVLSVRRKCSLFLKKIKSLT